eukprot:scaffold8877_cov112-Isochrysis_galbana.AAC.10
MQRHRAPLGELAHLRPLDLARLSAVVEAILGAGHGVHVEQRAQAVLAQQCQHTLEFLQRAISAPDVRTCGGEERRRAGLGLEDWAGRGGRPLCVRGGGAPSQRPCSMQPGGRRGPWRACASGARQEALTIRDVHPVAHRDAHDVGARVSNGADVLFAHPRAPVPAQLLVALGRSERLAEGKLVHPRVERRVGPVLLIETEELVEERRRDPRLEDQPAAQVGPKRLPLLLGRLYTLRTCVRIGGVIQAAPLQGRKGVWRLHLQKARAIDGVHHAAGVAEECGAQSHTPRRAVGDHPQASFSLRGPRRARYAPPDARRDWLDEGIFSSLLEVRKRRWALRNMGTYGAIGEKKTSVFHTSSRATGGPAC